MDDAELFISAVDPPAELDESNTCWFLVADGQIVIVSHQHSLLPGEQQLRDAALIPEHCHYLGWRGDTHFLTAALSDELPSGFELRPLRSLFGLLDDFDWVLAGRAAQIVAWDRDHRFCGRCGNPTTLLPGERARRCPVCGLTNYPRVAPAVITLIERDGKALLAKNAASTTNFYSCLAGFVEPGESLEEALQREVREEAGIEITGIEYFGSQPWPFPHSLMVGFRAKHKSGELRFEPSEIAEGGWFDVNSLPTVPSPVSIARKLIDDYVTRNGGDPNQPGLLAWTN